MIEANRESVAVVYSACWWSVVLLAFMESAHRKPIAANGIVVPPLLPAFSDAGPTSFAMIMHSLRNRGGVSCVQSSGQRLLLLVVSIECPVIRPYRPTNSGELVCQRAGRLVVAGTLLEGEGPGLELESGFALNGQLSGPCENGAGTVGQERSQIDIAALGNPAQASSHAGAVLS